MNAGNNELSALVEAAYRHALSGRLVQAEALVVQARQCRPLREGAQESVEVMLIEGVVHTYKGEVDAARDRFRRVAALGTLMPADSDAAAHAWGWQALLEYNRGDVLAAADCVGRACADPARARPLTRLRVAVNAALLCEYAGQQGAARGWLAAARAVAPACGVPGITGVIAYDLAAVRLSEAAVQHLRRPTPTDAARALLLQVQSAIHFDAATGVQVQAPLHDIVQAMALRLLGQPADAIPLLERYIAQARCVAAADLQSAQVELVACRLAADPAHDHPALETDLEAALWQIADPGERAHAADLLGRLAERRRDADAAGRWQAVADAFLAEHDARRTALADRLAALALTVVPPAWARPGNAPP